jgi:hypothetical protein
MPAPIMADIDAAPGTRIHTKEHFTQQELPRCEPSRAFQAFWMCMQLTHLYVIELFHKIIALISCM